MSPPLEIRREDVIEILAAYRSGSSAPDTESIDSVERAWLIDRLEQRHGIELDFAAESLARMTSVDDAVEVLREAALPVERG